VTKISVWVVLACIGAMGATALSQAVNAGPGGPRVLVRVPDAGMRFELRGLREARGVSGREGATGRLARVVPPAPINTEDPADSLYRARCRNSWAKPM